MSRIRTLIMERRDAIFIILTWFTVIIRHSKSLLLRPIKFPISTDASIRIPGGKIVSQRNSHFSWKRSGKTYQKHKIEEVVFSYSWCFIQLRHVAQFRRQCSRRSFQITRRRFDHDQKQETRHLDLRRQTGSGKSQTTRRVSGILQSMGLSCRDPSSHAVRRSGKTKVQRFGSIEDLKSINVRSKRSKNMNRISSAAPLYTQALDYGAIIKQAEKRQILFFGTRE